MKILLFGVSNVGKTTVGKLLSEKLAVGFYDLDQEIKTHLGMTLEEFVNTSDLHWRDQKRGSMIKRIISFDENLVLSVTPISYIDNFKTRIAADDILMIELYDTPENIFSRLVFSDVNDNVYEDVEYKEAHRDHYLKEIRSDLDWYGKVFHQLGIRNRVFVNNDPPEKVAQRIIETYNLDHI